MRGQVRMSLLTRVGKGGLEVAILGVSRIPSINKGITTQVKLNQRRMREMLGAKK